MENKTKTEILRAIKFSLISLSAGLIELGSFELFDKAFHWVYWLSHLISITLSVLWNFTINRKYTFKSANNVSIAMLLVALFYVAFIPLSSYLGNLWENAGGNADVIKIVTLMCNFVLEFLYTRFVVYRNSCDTAVKKSENSSEHTAEPEDNENHGNNLTDQLKTAECSDVDEINVAEKETNKA